MLKNKVIVFSIFFLSHISNGSAQCVDSTLISDFPFCENYFNLQEFENAFDPVCGCDGKTYFAPICAMSSGITEWTPGPCDPCFDESNKDSIPFHFPVQSVSITLPRSAVCGCDNKTYLNSKLAYIAGNTSWEKGSCSCIDSSVINLNLDFSLCNDLIYVGYEVLSNGDPNDPRPLLKGCDGNFYRNICEAYHKHGVTRFTSLTDFDCFVLPETEIDTMYVCGSEYDPVCGCNRVTYHNACVAEKHYGIIEHYKGECDCIDDRLIGHFNVFDSIPNHGYGACAGTVSVSQYSPVCGCDLKTYFNACIALNHFGIPYARAGECQCIDSSMYDPFVECDTTFLDPFCACDGKAYANLCEAVFKNAVVGRRECNCVEESFISEEIDCNEIFNYDPVCGCDGRTYPNLCNATRKGGVVIYRRGECENTCQDSILILDEVPCDDFYDPVCGCDLVTYQNECHARYKNGVLKWDPGPCTVSSNTDKKTEINVSVYPNPTSGKLFLSGISQGDFVILNASGQIMVSGKQAPALDISHLSPGIYFLRLFNEQKSFQSFKVIKI